jgi:hypothetical protein
MPALYRERVLYRERNSTNTTAKERVTTSRNAAMLTRLSCDTTFHKTHSSPSKHISHA